MKIRRINMPTLFYHSKYLIYIHNYAESYLKEEDHRLLYHCFFVQTKNHIFVCFFFKLSEIQTDTRQRERERSRKPDACLYVWKKGFWKVLFYFIFFETLSALAKAEASLSIACHSWRVPGADSFALSFLVKTRGGNYHWRAKGDLVTDLFTKLREAVTREVQTLPTPWETQQLDRKGVKSIQAAGGNWECRHEEKKNKYLFQKYIHQ